MKNMIPPFFYFVRDKENHCTGTMYLRNAG